MSEILRVNFMSQVWYIKKHSTLSIISFSVYSRSCTSLSFLLASYIVIFFTHSDLKMKIKSISSMQKVATLSMVFIRTTSCLCSAGMKRTSFSTRINLKVLSTDKPPPCWPTISHTLRHTQTHRHLVTYNMHAIILTPLRGILSIFTLKRQIQQHYNDQCMKWNRNHHPDSWQLPEWTASSCHRLSNGCNLSRCHYFEVTARKNSNNDDEHDKILRPQWCWQHASKQRWTVTKCIHLSTVLKYKFWVSEPYLSSFFFFSSLKMYNFHFTTFERQKQYFSLLYISSKALATRCLWLWTWVWFSHFSTPWLVF